MNCAQSSMRACVGRNCTHDPRLSDHVSTFVYSLAGQRGAKKGKLS